MRVIALIVLVISFMYGICSAEPKVFKSINSYPKYTDPYNDTIMWHIFNENNKSWDRSKNNPFNYYSLISENYFDTTFYIVSAIFSQNKILKHIQGVAIKKNGSRSSFSSMFGEKEYIRGDTLQVRYLYSLINKLNIDTFIKSGHITTNYETHEFLIGIIYFTLPLPKDSLLIDSIK